MGRRIEGRGRVTARQVFPKGRQYCAALLVGTMLGGLAAPASAQTEPPAAQTAAQPSQVPLLTPPSPAEPQRTIRSLTVTGNQRLEPETVLSYTALRPGEP